MKKIPYTQSAFDTILKNSRVFHNNQEVNPEKMTFNITNNTSSGEFFSSLVNDIDNYINEIKYDVDVKEMTRGHIKELFIKYGRFINKNIMTRIESLDYKYSNVLGQGFIINEFAAHLYNRMIID